MVYLASSNLLFSQFRFTTTTKNDVVTSNNVSSIDVHFALKNRGLYEDRAEIVFQNLITLATFVIVRPILVIVGNQVDQDTLKPAIPYAPKKPTSHEVKRIVGGVVSALLPCLFA